MKKTLHFFIVLLIPMLAMAENHDGTGKIYVKAGSTGDGSSWANATGSLQAAINASGVTEVWVAAGTYNGGSNGYTMKNGVAIYGGFVGTENALADRNWNANQTILTGGGTHKVIGGTDYSGLSATTILDGFIIENGNNSTSGGGLRFLGQHPNYASPTLRNLIIRNNTTATSGGGMYVNVGRPTLINVLFANNSATNKGGAIYTAGTSGSYQLVNTTFTGNKAANGGAIWIDTYAVLTINNSIIWGNTKTDGSTINNIEITGGVHNGSQRIVHENNLVQGWQNLTGNPTTPSNVDPLGYNGGANGGSAGNIDGNPLFVSATDFTLQSTSPAINAGKNSFYIGLDANTKDLTGNPRVQNTTIDMGAYEYQGTLPVTLVSFTAKADGNRAKLQWQTASELNNKDFEIYRSGDDKQFVKIGSQPATGNTQPTTYNYTDNSPLNGNNYYKLVQVDNDGTATELDVKILNFRLPTSDIRLFPNPAENWLTVVFEVGKYSQLQLVNTNGKVLQNVAINNTENSKTLDIATYPAGIYIVKLNGTTQAEIKKVVKK